MYRLYRNCKETVCRLYEQHIGQEGIFITGMIALGLLKSTIYFLWLLSSGRGIPQSDDSKWYLDYAQGLLQHFSVGLHMNDIMYFGYNVLLALLMGIFNDPKAVVVLQIITSSCSVFFVYKIAAMLFNQTTAVLAAIFYCLIWDFTLWSIYILSDSFFVSLLLLCVYLLLMAVETKRLSYKTACVLTTLYLMVFRPTGILVAGVILMYLAIRLDKQRLWQLLRRRGRVIGIAAVLGVGALGYLYTQHYLDALIHSLRQNVISILYNVYAKGWIYDKSTTYDYVFKPDYSLTVGDSVIASFIVNNWENILTIYGRRAAAFLGTWVWNTKLSDAVGIVSLLGNLIPAALFMVGTAAALYNEKMKKASILWLLTLAIVAFCIVLFIDAMYRYRFPAMPFIAIIGAYGTERIICGGNSIAKRYAGQLLYGPGKDADCDSRLQ